MKNLKIFLINWVLEITYCEMYGCIDNDYMGSKEYKDELDVFSKLRVKQVFKRDEEGDLIFGEDRLPVVDYELTSKPLVIDEKTCFVS